LEVKETVKPPLGAFLEIDTVPVADTPDTTDFGATDSEVTD
jgi:hypothetical protein